MSAGAWGVLACGWAGAGFPAWGAPPGDGPAGEVPPGGPSIEIVSGLLAGREATTNGLVAELWRAVDDAMENHQARGLRALRRLDDPELRPLFASLALQGQPSVRLEGILGLAETQTPHRIDLLLVKRIAQTRDQGQVLSEAIRSGMLDADQLADVARWPDIDGILRVLVLGEITRRGREPDGAMLRTLARDESPLVAFSAAVLLREGGVKGPSETVVARLVELGPVVRSRVLASFLAFVREMRLEKSRPIVRAIMDDHRLWEDDPLMRFEVLRAMATIDPEGFETITEWTERFAKEEGSGGKIRLGMLALDLALLPRREGPRRMLEALEADPDELLRAMGRAGKSLRAQTAEGAPAGADEMLALIAFGHPPTVAWALRAAANRPEDQAEAIRLAVIEVAAKRGAKERELYELAASAAEHQAAVRVEALSGPLEASERGSDRALASAIWSGVLDSAAPEAVAIVGPEAPSMPVPGAIARLVRARHAQAGGDSEQHGELAAIALDAGRMPDTVRVQAAWLALKASGAHRTALALVVSRVRERAKRE